ncbi:MAG: ATP synthase F1 subunit epsilon [Leadbetterella sp.]
MNLEIITPDKNAFRGEVDAITLPGTNGQFQVLKDHAPMVSTLGKGDLTYEISGQKSTLIIDGGVIEVSNNKVLILAESVA